MRLVHAAVRHLICEHAKEDPTLWDDGWGVPINQEDLVGTLMTFSTVVLDALDKVGVEVRDDEADAYVHTWNVISHILGIDDVVLARDARDASDLVSTIQQRQWASSIEGVRMTEALIGLMQSLIPGRHNDGLPAAMIRYLIGERAAEMIGVHPEARDRAVTGFLFLITQDYLDKRSRNRRLERLGEALGRALLANSSLVHRHRGRPPFRVPESLRAEWKVGGPNKTVAQRFTRPTHDD